MTSVPVHDEHADSGFEPEGVSGLHILGMTVVGGLILAVLVLIAVQLARSEFRTAEGEAVALTGYPALVETRIAGVEKLTQYGVVDAAARRYRIPVDRAMDLMVNEAAAEGDRPVSNELRLTR
jgi:hypothetical protein